MTCPNCGAANPDGAIECGSCGVVFEKWRRKQEAAQAAAAPALAAGAEKPRSEARAAQVSLPVAPLAGALVLAVAALLGFSRPSGRGVPPSSVAAPGGFFLRAPEGWRVLVRDCPSERKPCPIELSRSGPDPAEAVAEATGGLPPALSGVVFFEGPRVAPDREVDFEAAYLPDWRAEVDRFTPGTKRWTQLDGLRAVRLEGSGPKHIREEIRKPLILKEKEAAAKLRELNPTATVITYNARFSGKKGDYVPEVVVDPGEYREAEYQVALEALLVSGRSHTLRLACRAQDVAKGQCAGLLDELAKGLNVTDRPRRLELWLSSPLAKP